VTVLITLGLFSIGAYLILAVAVLVGSRQIGQLSEVEPAPPAELPKVSIIIPALNEAATIEPALASVLALDYPDLEVIAINDRSTDQTGAILERLASAEPRLQVFHIKELPAGWLGKNHALWYGADRASGELLLFTDADVVMSRGSLRRAVSYMLARRLDHLAVFFDVVVPGGLLNMLMIDFASAFMAGMRPWKARQEKSRCHIGVGAFNLVRAKAYQVCGSHRAIALQPVDDVELGRLLKESGGRQDLLFGRTDISVAWYGSVDEMIRGLEKNIFPYLGYSLIRTAAVSLVVVLLRIWPFLALFFTDGLLLSLNGILLAMQLAAALFVAANSSIAVRHLVWFPFSAFVGLYIIWHSAIRTLLRGGILWRGSFYSLEELKKSGRISSGPKRA
jgi:glycosyltransferase involved in cell wall biosynthesis